VSAFGNSQNNRRTLRKLGARSQQLLFIDPLPIGAASLWNPVRKAD